jgi:hypothetical protein
MSLRQSRDSTGKAWHKTCHDDEKSANVRSEWLIKS